MLPKKKIAIVNQRYGLEINGGSEYYTRRLAEQLNKSEEYEIEILTTQAVDYMTWANEYASSEEIINDIKVRRFAVDSPRRKYRMKMLRVLSAIFKILRLNSAQTWAENRWIAAQGPCSSGLIDFISDNKDKYDKFVFVTYLYYTTVKGLERVKDKSILIPTAHDEAFIYYAPCRQAIEDAGAIIYLTPEEKQFVERHFAVKDKPNAVCGMGIELPEEINAERFRAKYKIDSDYIVYAGRIEKGKGCKVMFDSFEDYRATHNSQLKLVLMGKNIMDIPRSEDVMNLGFVSEEDKFDGIAGAKALWLPSPHESLSIAVLEAMALGVPVIVNGECEVLKGHIERSDAGVFYMSAKEASDKLGELMDKIDRSGGAYNELYVKAKRYVEENYQWNAIIEDVDRILHF